LVIYDSYITNCFSQVRNADKVRRVVEQIYDDRSSFSRTIVPPLSLVDLNHALYR